jgi:hypothetical protein
MRLTLLPDHDSCYYLKSEAGDSIFPYRRMKIIENSLSDSVNVGFSMVGPNDKGEVLNLRIDESVDNAQYPEGIDLTGASRAKLVCINIPASKKVTGKLVLELKY